MPKTFESIPKVEFQTLVANSGLICGVLSSSVLLLFRESRKTANVFLGISVLLLTHILLCALLNNTGWILKVPFLMRTGNIVIYLFVPFLYLFYRGVFKGEKNWQPLYFIFFVPSLIFLVDYFPFFTMPTDDKVDFFAKKLANPSELIRVDEGLFGWSHFHFTFRTLWSAFFMYLIARILIEFRGDFRNSASPKDVMFYIRLVVLWGIVFILLLLPAMGFLIFKFKEYTQLFIMSSMAITLFLITLNLLFSPRILYGYYWTREGEARASVPPYAPKTSDDGDGVQVLKNLSAIVKEKSLYENVGYTIHNLAQEAKIPSYRISYLINTHTDGNFSKWINSFRIEKFIALSENGDTSKYTLDSIAPECGFSSRSTLTSAFKKEKGITPGQYMKQISFKG